MSESMVVDVHNHIIPPGLLEAVGQGKFEGFALDYKQDRIDFVVDGEATPVRLRDHEVEGRMEAMDRMGVRVQALSVLPPAMGYQMPIDKAIQICQIANYGIASFMSTRPDRFVGLATVPLQEPSAATAELRRAMTELGFRGVQIGANVRGMDLGEERFFPFWESVADLDAFVFVHPPHSNVPAVERMSRYHLWNLVGFPLDTTLAIASLIFGGILDRWPTLKVCCAHGGGLVPYKIGRFDHAYEVRSDVRKNITRPPSTYLKQLFFDTITHGVDALEFLVGKVGAGQVLVGTDYPAGMGDATPVKTVAGLGMLNPADRAQVLGTTAARLLKLSN